MINNFSELTRKYLENAKKYDVLADSVKSNAGLTREALVENLKEIAVTGKQVLEESKDLMSALGLFNKAKNPAPEFDLEDADALYDFARKCNKSSDLPWSDEEKYDDIDDSFLAIDILDIVIQTAAKYEDLGLKIRAIDLFSHHCINSAMFFSNKAKNVCSDILKLSYESLPSKTFKDAKTKLAYALIILCYSLFILINDAEESFDNLFNGFNRAQKFNEKYKPPLNSDIKWEEFGSNKQADAFEEERDLVWDKEWEKPEIKAWANTLMEGATREQARELAKRWCNYALNINMVKSYAGHFNEHMCQHNKSNYIRELNMMYSSFFGVHITSVLSDPGDLVYKDVMNSALSDGNRTVMFVGWVLTAISIIEHNGRKIEMHLKLLPDIIKGIMSVSKSENWYKQIMYLESLITACAFLCKHIDELPEEERKPNLKLVLEMFSYMRELNKDLKKGICVYRKELNLILNSCSGIISRRECIEILFGIASKDHLPTYAHSLVVARLNKTIAEYAFKHAPELIEGIRDIKNITEEMELAGLAHDLGKIFQIHSVSQCARPLTETEYYDVIRRHTEIGSDILEISGFELQRACAGYHHAFTEGNGNRGYPENAGVKDLQYKAAINITHISDVLSAITDNLGRFYEKPRTVEEAFEQILKDSQNINGNVELDPAIVKFIIGNKELNKSIREILASYNEEAYWTAYKTIV